MLAGVHIASAAEAMAFAARLGLNTRLLFDFITISGGTSWYVFSMKWSLPPSLLFHEKIRKIRNITELFKSFLVFLFYFIVCYVHNHLFRLGLCLWLLSSAFLMAFKGFHHRLLIIFIGFLVLSAVVLSLLSLHSYFIQKHIDLNRKGYCYSYDMSSVAGCLKIVFPTCLTMITHLIQRLISLWRTWSE